MMEKTDLISCFLKPEYVNWESNKLEKINTETSETDCIYDSCFFDIFCRSATNYKAKFQETHPENRLPF